MNFFARLLSGGVKDAAEGVGTLLKDVRSALTGNPNPEEVLKLQNRLMELEFMAQKTQTDINLQEAKHPNVFVSGWRPFIGWVCGSALAYNFIINPLITWIVQLLGKNITPPVLDVGSLMTVVLSMLGLGGMRSFEKFKGVNGKH